MATPGLITSFKLEEPIKSGGMGTAWRARHRATGTAVAVKTIRQDRGTDASDRRALFVREARALARLDHRGIIQLLDFGQTRQPTDNLPQGTLYLVMEFADGGELTPESVDCWPDLDELLIQLLDALAHAHSRHRIHLDIKPENILRTGDGSAATYRLADFGIARITTEFDRPHPSSGTPIYIAPEQARGQWRSLGPWSDLYALGCVAWELACGTPPFRASTPMAVILHHLNEPLPSFTPRFEVAPGFEQWLRRLLAKAPPDRFQTAADAAYALPQGPERPSRSASGESTTPPPQTGLATTLEAPPPGPTTLIGALQHSTPTRRISDLETEPLPESDLSPPDINATAIDDTWRPPFPTSWQLPERPSLLSGLDDVGLGLFDLRPAPFVGRRALLETLWDTTEAAIIDRQPTLVTIEGPSGVGKTRLVDAVATRLLELGQARILRFNFEERHWRDAVSTGLARFFNIVGADGDTIKQQVQLRLPSISAHHLDLLLQLLDADTGRQPDATDVFEELAQLIETLAARRPLVVIADGISIDPFGLDLYDVLCSSNPEVPVLFVAAIPTDHTSPLISRRVSDYPEDRGHRLEPLNGSEVYRSMAQMFPLADDELECLIDHVGADLDFGRQILANWLDADVLEPGPHGYRAPPQLPSSTRALWRQRLRAIYGPDACDGARRALAVAAVLGVSVRKSTWQQTCRRLDIECDASILHTAAAKGVIVDEGTRLRFSESSLRRALMTDLRQRNRFESVSRTAAAVLKERQDRTSLFRAARCLEDAGCDSKAVELLVSAGSVCSTRDARISGNWMESILDGSDDLSVLDRVYTITTQALNHIEDCDFETADRYLQRAEAILERHPLESAQRHYDHALATRMLFAERPRDGIDLAVSLVTDRTEGESAAGLIATQRLVAALYFRCREFSSALEHLDAAQALNDGDPISTANIEFSRGQIGIYCAPLRRARRHLESAMSQYRDIDDPSGVLLCRQQLGFIAFLRQDHHRARRLLRRTLRSATRTNYHGALTIRERLARLEARCGNPRAAIDHLRPVRRAAETRGFNILIQYFFDVHAEAVANTGDYSAIEDIFEEALHSDARLGLRADVAVDTWHRVADIIASRRPALADAIDAEARRISQTHSTTDLFTDGR